MGKLLGALVVLVILGFGWVYFTDTDVEGDFEAPEVNVEGGEVPEVEVRGPEIETGTKEVTAEVPTVSVDVPEDDADGEETELADDEGLNAEVDADVDADVDVEERQ